jgi:hypothetical protein
VSMHLLNRAKMDQLPVRIGSNGRGRLAEL